jgi:hypothetical protein
MRFNVVFRRNRSMFDKGVNGSWGWLFVVFLDALRK